MATDGGNAGRMPHQMPERVEETQAVQFGIYIRMLKHHYTTTGIADTVYKAVEAAAKGL